MNELILGDCLEVLRNIENGKQTYKFKTGEYQIAVKVVDNEGLESLEVIKLKINGVLTVQ